MKEEMKRQSAEYVDNQPIADYEQDREAFEAGWEAACDYLCELPFDEMLDVLSKRLKERGNE